MDTKLVDKIEYDWRKIECEELEIVLDQHTYMKIPNGLLDFYMDQKSLRWLIELSEKSEEKKWVRMCIEQHIGGSNTNILRYQHEDYVKNQVRYNKEWCFGILFKDNTIEGGYLLCTLKAINIDDFRKFALFLLDQVKTAKREMDLLDRFKFQGNERKEIRSSI